MKVLITSGATCEKIDDVRFITNMSTGKTGAFIADYLVESGFDITYVFGENSYPSQLSQHTHKFTDFLNLDSILQMFLRNSDYDAIIHLAAVSDYSVDKITDLKGHSLSSRGKISSSTPLLLQLKPNFKIIDKIREYSKNRKIKVVGFKLTHLEDSLLREETVDKLFKSSRADYIVHNDLTEFKNQKNHPFHIYKENKIYKNVQDTSELAKELSFILRNES